MYNIYQSYLRALQESNITQVSKLLGCSLHDVALRQTGPLLVLREPCRACMLPIMPPTVFSQCQQIPLQAMHYHSIGVWARDSYWGLLEWQDQDTTTPATAPKYRVRGPADQLAMPALTLATWEGS